MKKRRKRTSPSLLSPHKRHHGRRRDNWAKGAFPGWLRFEDIGGRLRILLSISFEEVWWLTEWDGWAGYKRAGRAVRVYTGRNSKRALRERAYLRIFSRTYLLYNLVALQPDVSLRTWCVCNTLLSIDQVVQSSVLHEYSITIGKDYAICYPMDGPKRFGSLTTLCLLVQC